MGSRDGKRVGLVRERPVKDPQRLQPRQFRLHAVHEGLLAVEDRRWRDSIGRCAKLAEGII